LKFRGQVFLTFTFAYGVLRFLLEILRDDFERGEFGPHIAEHIMIAGGLFIFALAYIFFMAPSVNDPTMRKMTQVIALVPALVAFLLMRPASFAEANLLQLSTSQWVAILTAVPAAIAYGIYFKAAEAHPDSALAIDLTEYQRSHPETAQAAAETHTEASVSQETTAKRAAEDQPATAATSEEANEAPRVPPDETARPTTDEKSP
jgi:phosphatidylglycerol:prolipoprotein diacylglycerol transferase